MVKYTFIIEKVKHLQKLMMIVQAINFKTKIIT